MNMSPKRILRLEYSLWIPFFLTLARAQVTSSVTCMANYSWAANSLGQSPCLVAAYLGGACNNGKFSIGPLQKSYHYAAPTAAEIDDTVSGYCLCSTPYYMLLSACGGCQNETWDAYAGWSTNCNSAVTPDPGVFLLPIPDDTLVPHWAYLLPADTGGTFNPADAKLAGDGPESSGFDLGGIETSFLNELTSLFDVPLTDGLSITLPGPGPTIITNGVPTATGSIPLGTGGLPKQTQSPPSTPSSNSKKSSNLPAIIGGVVGGIAVILIIGFIIWRVKRTPARYDVPSATAPPPPTIGAGYVTHDASRGLGTSSSTPGIYEEAKATPDMSYMSPHSMPYLVPAGAPPPFEASGSGMESTGYVPTQFHPIVNAPSPVSPTSPPDTGFEYRPTSYQPTTHSGGATTNSSQPTAHLIGTGYAGMQPDVSAPHNRGYSGMPEL